jgi:hypothetical protein
VRCRRAQGRHSGPHLAHDIELAVINLDTIRPDSSVNQELLAHGGHHIWTLPRSYKTSSLSSNVIAIDDE